jgi:hypothetical protein
LITPPESPLNIGLEMRSNGLGPMNDERDIITTIATPTAIVKTK